MSGKPDFSENALVEQPAIALFSELGYTTVNCHGEKVGTVDSTLGRETTADVVLVPMLRAALKKLNPASVADALDQAIEQLTRDRSGLSPAHANREIYKLLKEGVKVTYQADDGNEADDTLRVPWPSTCGTPCPMRLSSGSRERP